jgi:hypothetical protein
MYTLTNHGNGRSCIPNQVVHASIVLVAETAETDADKRKRAKYGRPQQHLEDNDELRFSQNNISPPATIKDRIAPDFILDTSSRWRTTRLRSNMKTPLIRKTRPTPRKRRKLRTGGQQVCNFQFIMKNSSAMEGLTCDLRHCLSSTAIKGVAVR